MWSILRKRSGQFGKLVCRSFSSYQQEASHLLQASQSNMTPELSVYRESEVRELLADFPGGKVDLNLDSKSGVATITFSNPPKRNAFSGTMMVEFADCVSELDRWRGDGKAVVLRGAEAQFCSGSNLEFVNAIADPVNGAKMSIFMQTATSKFGQLPLISVADVQGYALGGGAELSVACDFRVFGREARIGFIHCRLGVSPAWGGGTNLCRIVGPRKALDLLASAKIISADEAFSIGLADDVLQADEGGTVADWLERRFGQSSANCLRAAKRVVLNATVCDYSESLDRERDVFCKLWGGAGHKAALNALAEQQAKAAGDQ